MRPADRSSPRPGAPCYGAIARRSDRFWIERGSILTFDSKEPQKKAAAIHEFGDVDVLTYEDVPTPKPKAGHILAKVLAAGVNRLDPYIREGSVVPGYCQLEAGSRRLGR